MALAVLQELKHNIEQEVPSVDAVQSSLNALADAVSGHGPAPRQEVIDAGGVDIIVKASKYFCNTGEENVRVLTPEAERIRTASLNALARLSIGFPHIVDEFGLTMIAQAFYNLTSETTKLLGLKLMRNACVKNEANRERLADEYHIAEPFVHLITRDKPSGELVRDWCEAARAFTLGDDPSVAYNRADERKRLLCQRQAHHYLCEFLFAFEDEPTLNSVVIALSLLARIEDFCVAIEANGGLRGLQRILETYGASKIQLTKNANACLRYMYMSPIVREKGGSTPIVKMVTNLAVNYRELSDFVEIAVSCLAFITLRNPCACAQFLIAHGVHSLLEIMKMYLESPQVLKWSCLILRNIATISGKIGRLTILDVGGDAELRTIGRQYPDLVAHHVNPVLHDLGLDKLSSRPVTGDVRVPSPSSAPHSHSQSDGAGAEGQSENYNHPGHGQSHGHQHHMT